MADLSERDLLKRLAERHQPPAWAFLELPGWEDLP